MFSDTALRRPTQLCAIVERAGEVSFVSPREEELLLHIAFYADLPEWALDSGLSWRQGEITDLGNLRLVMRFANSGTISIDHRAVTEQTEKIIFHLFIRRFKEEELLLHIALLADLSRYGRGLGVQRGVRRGLEPSSMQLEHVLKPLILKFQGKHILAQRINSFEMRTCTEPGLWKEHLLHVADDVDLDTLGTWLRPDRSFSKPETIIRVVPPPNNDPSSHPLCCSPEIRKWGLFCPILFKIEWNIIFCCTSRFLLIFLHMDLRAFAAVAGMEKGDTSCNLWPYARTTSCKTRLSTEFEHLKGWNGEETVLLHVVENAQPLNPSERP
jgi:hypothetical protein